MLRKRKKPTLVYFMSETHFFSKDYSVLVVNLVGTLSQDTVSALHDCQEQIQKSSSKWVILNFRDVFPLLEPDGLKLLKDFHQAILNRPLVLRFAGVHPDIKKTLVDHGMVKDEELFNNLADALKHTSTIAPSKDAA